MALDSRTGRTDDKIPAYEPTPEEAEWLTRLNDFYERGYMDRRVQEGAWFLAAAYFRGNQSAVWSDADQRLLLPPGPRRRREIINQMQRKVLSRRAKFLRNRPKPEVRPATPDIEDKLNARYTQRALDFQQRRLNLEQAYDDALMWGMLASRGYIWLYWNPEIKVRANDPDMLTGQTSVVEAKLGDIELEVGSPFEFIAGDPAQPHLSTQRAIMRCKIRTLDEIKQRYPEKGLFVKSDDGMYEESMRQAKYISGLASGGWATAVSGVFTRSYARGSDTSAQLYKDRALVKEYFERPSPEHPDGLHIVTSNGVILKIEETLPEGFADMANPFPCVDFPDVLHPGQYWGSTIAEQLIGPQQSYNRLRTILDRHLRRGSYPKIIVDRRHRLAEGAWTDEDNEIVEVTNVVGIPPPQPWSPPSVAADVWRTINILTQEFDTVSGIYREAEGQFGKASSGFQTNLLQEATDSVHQPDIMVHMRSLEDLYRKMRRMMKKHYIAKRLITISGRNTEPEVFEFSEANIDEYADLVIETGSMLPELKSARIQSILELWRQGVYGPPNDPSALRNVQKHLEFGTREELYDFAAADEERARLENLRFQQGQDTAPALFCDNHDLHYQLHADDMKKAQARGEPWNVTIFRVKHMLTHARYINPEAAMQIAAEYSLPVPPPPGQPLAPPGSPMPPLLGNAPGPQPPPTPEPPPLNLGTLGEQPIPPQVGMGIPPNPVVPNFPALNFPAEGPLGQMPPGIVPPPPFGGPRGRRQ